VAGRSQNHRRFQQDLSVLAPASTPCRCTRPTRATSLQLPAWHLDTDTP
jgi:hypothetical protein